MKKIIRLTESDLIRLVKRVISEQKVVSTSVSAPSAMGQIFSQMRKSCPGTIDQLRNVISILGSGSDYKTFSQTGTWGEFLDLLNKLNNTLEQEMSRVTKTTNPMFKKIQDLCLAQGIKPKDKCVVEFQQLVLSKAKGENELETESGKTEWVDGIVGLATLQSLVIGMIDFFQSVLAKNPELTNSSLIPQDAKNLPKYSGIKDVEQKVGTMQR